MSERWKPKVNEPYGIIVLEGVAKSTWLDDSVDERRWQSGNCFKTKEEAESALEKVKALLLSLHCEPVTNCNQLPKLTADVFNRPDCPEWVKWAAVDSNGAGYYYSEKPFILSDAFGWGIVCSETNQSELISGKFNNSDWKNSLIERPAKLPDWCKVGEWVYLSNAKYYKIEKVDSYGIILNNGIVIKTDDIHAEAVSARLRPYNADELRGLVGMVICKGPSIHFVTGWENVLDGESMVHVNGCLYNAKDLLRHGFTYDTRPCGALEHLENGEWVE